MISECDLHNEDHSATYCPEDNKLRIYINTASERVTKETWLHLKALGFKPTPKQDCNFVATWTPGREDAVLQLIPEGDDIGDEDTPPQERAEQRAERFAGYRDKRRSEAHGHANDYDAGPSVYGHQNQQRAERQARRHDRHRTRAITQWSKAEYWQQRTAGVISNALHKSSPATRRKRILRLEKEHRVHMRDRNKIEERFAGWQEVLTMPGADQILPIDENGYRNETEKHNPAQAKAYRLSVNCLGEWEHPDHPGFFGSTYDLLTGGTLTKNRMGKEETEYRFRRDGIRQLTPAEVAQLYVAGRDAPFAEGGRSNRWRDHYELRLMYENAMLENEGGKAADVEMVPGGFLGKYQIEKVHKSPATGRVVSVSIRGHIDEWTKRPARINIEKFGADVYRAPTDEESAEFAQFLEDRKTAKKAAAKKNPTPKLVNPTKEDAERLQAIWNAAGKESAKRGGRSEPQESTVLYVTQAQYSANSRGSYSHLQTIEVTERLEQRRSYYHGASWNGDAMFKIRKASAGGFCYDRADRVICIADKPQKPLPFEQCAERLDQRPTVEQLAQKIELTDEFGKSWFDEMSDDAKAYFWELYYWGLSRKSSESQFGLSDAGRQWKREAVESQQATAAGEPITSAPDESTAEATQENVQADPIAVAVAVEPEPQPETAEPQPEPAAKVVAQWSQGKLF